MKKLFRRYFKVMLKLEKRLNICQVKAIIVVVNQGTAEDDGHNEQSDDDHKEGAVDQLNELELAKQDSE